MRYPRRTRKMMCRSDKIGGIILNWLWEKEERWVPVFTNLELYEFQHNLCYLLAAEDLDDYVIKPISTHLPQSKVRQIRSSNKIGGDHWRGMALREIIKAHLAIEADNSANDAIDLFGKVAAKQLAAKHWRLREQNNQSRSIALWPSIMQIRKSLCSGQMRQTSPQKFDYFVNWFKRYARKYTTPRITLAQLDLFHPSRRTADSFLELCREDAVNGIQGETSSALENNSKFKEAQRRYSIGAIEILRNQGRSEDAQWLENYAAATFGKGALEQNDSQRYPAYKLWMKPPEESQDTSLTNGRTSYPASDTSKG